MAVKHVVVWGEDNKSQRLIPVDEELYGDSVVEAKDAAREHLQVKTRSTKLMPQEVMAISEEKFNAMLTGTTPLHTFNVDTPQEFEMLEIAV